MTASCRRMASGDLVSASVRGTWSPWSLNFTRRSSTWTRLTVGSSDQICKYIVCAGVRLSEAHINIPTYFLKEIYSSYITSTSAPTNPGDQEETLAMSMARLVRYAQTRPIASPFYGTKLGGEICYTCRNLFRDFQSKFEDEFEALKKEQDCAGNVSCKGFCNSISLPEQFRPRQEEVKERGINELIKNVNAHFNIWQYLIEINSKL